MTSSLQSDNSPHNKIPAGVKVQAPQWRCQSAYFRAVGSSPHALPRRNSHDQAHMDPSISRTSRQGVVIRVPGLSFITQCVNFQCGFFLQTATGFCTGQTNHRSSSYHMQITKLKQMHLYKKEFHFRWLAFCVDSRLGEKFLATSNLHKKLYWMFFASGLCLILLLAHMHL